MPKTAQAPAAKEETAEPEADSKSQARPVEFPDAPQDSTSGGGGQLDILLDMEVPVTAILGTTQIPVRRLLQLGPGSVLKLDKSIEAPVDLYLRESRFAEADVVVVDDQFAVRIKRIIGTGAAETLPEG
jgi:flagellar motor switch protein FliN/FliY